MKIVITSGGTREKIDPVRFIGNYSTGKMGRALAKAFADNQVVVIAANSEVEYSGRVVKVESAQEMLDACLKQLPCDIFIAAAAVADKRPKKYSAQKIKKDKLTKIELVENPDILQTIANLPPFHPPYKGGKRGVVRPKLVVGFAAESENHIKNARKKLTKKSCDLVVVNDITALGSDKNEVWVVGKNFEKKISKASKQVIANKIAKIIGEKYGQH